MIKGFDVFKVGEDPVFTTNLLDSGEVSLNDFEKALQSVSRLKNSLHEKIENDKHPISPGIQYNLKYRFCPYVEGIFNLVDKKVLDLSEKMLGSTPSLYMSSSWIYYQHNSVNLAFWHHHPKLTVDAQTRQVDVPIYLTYTVYLQVPDNNSKIWFAPIGSKKFGNKENVIEKGDMSFQPKLGSVAVFPGMMPHFPELHTESTTRVVLASMVHVEKPKSVI